jgi:hypothetical protein
MNEEQSDRVISILNDIKNEIATININNKINRESFFNLRRFKNEIINDEFFCSLNKAQKKFIVDITKKSDNSKLLTLVKTTEFRKFRDESK